MSPGSCGKFMRELCRLGLFCILPNSTPLSGSIGVRRSWFKNDWRRIRSLRTKRLHGLHFLIRGKNTITVKYNGSHIRFGHAIESVFENVQVEMAIKYMGKKTFSLERVLKLRMKRTLRIFDSGSSGSMSVRRKTTFWLQSIYKPYFWVCWIWVENESQFGIDAWV